MRKILRKNIINGEGIMLALFFVIMLAYFVGLTGYQDNCLQASINYEEEMKALQEEEERLAAQQLPDHLQPKEYIWEGYHEPPIEEPEDMVPAMGPIGRSVQGIIPTYMTFNTSAYCVCMACCGKTDAITKSGAVLRPWITVAAGPSIPFGTVIHIPSLDDAGGGGWFIVEDRGSAIGDDCLDIGMNNHSETEQFGRHWLEAEVYFK